LNAMRTASARSSRFPSDAEFSQRYRSTEPPPRLVSCSSSVRLPPAQLQFRSDGNGGTRRREGARRREGNTRPTRHSAVAVLASSRQLFSRFRVPPGPELPLRMRLLSEQRRWKTNRRRTEDELKKSNSPHGRNLARAVSCSSSFFFGCSSVRLPAALLQCVSPRLPHPRGRDRDDGSAVAARARAR
jgi:hypothetical protein